MTINNIGLEIDDRVTTVEDFREAKYGLFQSITPTIKFSGYKLDEIQNVQFDDGYDGTDDWIDITSDLTEGEEGEVAVYFNYAPLDV